MNIEKYQSRGIKFLILATKNDPVIIYMMEEVEITARHWEDAYQQVRDLGFTPFADEYQKN
jgi:hypothetical protein